MAHDRHLTPTATAERLGLSLRTLYRMARMGVGPPYIQVSARRRKYRISDVEAWERSRLQEG